MLPFPLHYLCLVKIRHSATRLGDLEYTVTGEMRVILIQLNTARASILPLPLCLIELKLGTSKIN